MNEDQFEALVASSLLLPTGGGIDEAVVKQTVERIGAWRRRRGLWTFAAAGVGTVLANAIAGFSGVTWGLADLARGVLEPVPLLSTVPTAGLYLVVAAAVAILSLTGAGALGRAR